MPNPRGAGAKGASPIVPGDRIPKTAARTRTGGAARSNNNQYLAAALRHHQESAHQSFMRLLHESLQSAMTIAVISIALALPAALYVLVGSLQQMGGNLDASARITLFLKRNTSSDAIDALRSSLIADQQIEQVEYISAKQALSEFKTHSGFGEVLDLLDENPLPPVLLVNPSGNPETQDIKALAESLRDNSLIESVQVDMEWLERLNGILTMGRQAIYALTLVLAFGVLLITGNTIRLAIENRREEILVVKLVGGTNAYIRRPFLYTGLWYGVFGGILSWVMVALGCWWLNISVEQLAVLYQSQWALKNPGVVQLCVIAMGSGLLGILGAWLAVGRQVSAIEP